MTTRSAQHGPAADAFSSALNAVAGTAALRLERTADEGTDRLKGMAVADGESSRGAKQQAATEGIRAALHGQSALWASLKGAWQGGGSKVKAALVTAVVAAGLLLVVSPVLLIVFLLRLLIIAAVYRARSATKQP